MTQRKTPRRIPTQERDVVLQYFIKNGNRLLANARGKTISVFVQQLWDEMKADPEYGPKLDQALLNRKRSQETVERYKNEPFPFVRRDLESMLTIALGGNVVFPWATRAVTPIAKDGSTELNELRQKIADLNRNVEIACNRVDACEDRLDILESK